VSLILPVTYRLRTAYASLHVPARARLHERTKAQNGRRTASACIVYYVSQGMRGAAVQTRPGEARPLGPRCRGPARPAVPHRRAYVGPQRVRGTHILRTKPAPSPARARAEAACAACDTAARRRSYKLTVIAWPRS
jgi:hypothetical protein